MQLTASSPTNTTITTNSQLCIIHSHTHTVTSRHKQQHQLMASPAASLSVVFRCLCQKHTRNAKKWTFARKVNSVLAKHARHELDWLTAQLRNFFFSLSSFVLIFFFFLFVAIFSTMTYSQMALFLCECVCVCVVLSDSDRSCFCAFESAPYSYRQKYTRAVFFRTHTSSIVIACVA